MNEEDEVKIAEIVSKALEKEHKMIREEEAKSEKKETKEKAEVTRRILICRCSVVISVIVTLFITHHFTHIEPVGKLGEVGIGAFFSWLFERNARIG